MSLLNVEQISKIVEAAEKGLKKKALGGFTPESTTEALKKTAQGVKELADNSIGKVQKELAEYKNKTACEMADLVSKKDTVILEKDSKITEVSSKLQQANEKIKYALSVKVSKPRTLSNGNIETAKVNKNGAKMVTETLPDGRKVKVSVETLDGDVRVTKYDPVTGKPVSTFTNTNSDKLIKYDKNGKAINQENVNVKKGNIQKPTVVSQQILQESDVKADIRRTYSDGSYEDIVFSKRRNCEVWRKKYDRKGREIESFERFADGSYTVKKFNSDDTKSYIIESFSENDKSIEKIFYDNNEKIKKIFTYPNGLKKTVKPPVNEFGIPDWGSGYQIKYTYPKNSRIKESLIDYPYYGEITNTLKMKDGSTVTIRVSNDYDPVHVTIRPKDGGEPKLLEDSAGEEFLDEIDYLASLRKRDIYTDDRFSSF